MKITKNSTFNKELKEILYYIASDNKNAAKSFKNALISKINDLVFMPYKFRKSIYHEDNTLRDLVFKGYVVVYKIDEKETRIIILGINKYKEKF